jgi:CRP/FNR family transcriptional regulator
MDPAGTLLRTPLFGDLTRADVEELLPDVRERTFGRGQVVWVEGDPADVLYVVVEGQLKSHRFSPDGREVILVVQSVGDPVGEVGLFHPRGTRWVNVTAMTPSRCLAVSRSALLAFLLRHPRALERMLESLSGYAVRAAYSLSGVAFDDIGSRVATVLLALGAEHGEPAPGGGTRIRVRLSQGELAAHVAASRENVNRALAPLVASGAVSHDGGHFTIHDRAALEKAQRIDL